MQRLLVLSLLATLAAPVIAGDLETYADGNASIVAKPKAVNLPDGIAIVEVKAKKLDLRSLLRGIQDQTMANVKYPNASKFQGHQGLVLVSFDLAKAGGVSNAAVSKSSGYKFLDAAALLAVSKIQAAALTDLDDDETVTVNVPVEFSLKSRG